MTSLLTKQQWLSGDTTLCASCGDLLCVSPQRTSSSRQMCTDCMEYDTLLQLIADERGDQ